MRLRGSEKHTHTSAHATSYQLFKGVRSFNFSCGDRCGRKLYSQECIVHSAICTCGISTIVMGRREKTCTHPISICADINSVALTTKVQHSSSFHFQLWKLQ